MALTDTGIGNAKARDSEYKPADGGGLYLLVTPKGGRLWRLKYRAHGVERKLSLGQYPTVTLADARKARDAARSSASRGDDPAAAKRRERIAKKLAAGTTFGAIALEYIEKAEREGRSPATITKLHWAREWLQLVVGHRPITEIQPHELLALLKKQEKKGKLETAKRTRSFASRVFRYAIATARAKTDPASLLLDTIAAPRPKNLAAIIDPTRAGELGRHLADFVAPYDFARRLKTLHGLTPYEVICKAWTDPPTVVSSQTPTVSRRDQTSRADGSGRPADQIRRDDQ